MPSSSSSSSSSSHSSGSHNNENDQIPPERKCYCSDCNCQPPPGEQCVPDGSGNPVQYSTGQLQLVQADLSSRAFGLSWGHTRSYANVLNDNSLGLNGSSWIIAEQAKLVFPGWIPGPSQPEKICVVTGASSSQWFIKTLAGGYEPEFGGLMQMVWNETVNEYMVTYPNGWRWIFNDHTGSTSEALRGVLKQIIDPAGRITNAAYQGNGYMTSLEQDWEGRTSGYYYTYLGIAGHTRLASVTLKLNGLPVERAVFSYYGAGADGGMPGDLQLASVEQYDAGSRTWNRIRRRHYRYYTTGQPNGFEHGLKYVVEAASFERMVAAGLNPLTSEDSVVATYADYYFEYDGQRRVSLERVRGGSEESTFAYVNNIAAPGPLEVDVWNVKTTETLPDGNEIRVYTNTAGQVLLKILEETATDDQWCDFYEYDEGYRLLLHAHPSAVAAVSEPVGDSGDLEVDLRPSDGLIEVWDYYIATDLETGAVEGRLHTKGVQKGSTGTPEITQKYEYLEHSADGATLHPIKAEYEYPEAGMPDGEASKTSWDYTWYLDGLEQPTFQILEEVKTLPVVSVDQNGSGTAYEERTVYNAFGQMAWRMNARGVIDFMSYEEATGALKQWIADVDTSRMAEVPSGWETLPGFGRHLVTDYVSDDQGRIVQERGPWHEVQLRATDTSATPVRRVKYTVYQDILHEVRRAEGYMTGQGVTPELQVVGGISITRMDANGRITDEIVSARCCSCGPLTATESLPQEKWSKWTQTLHDAWGRVRGTRLYHTIPASGEGEMGANFWESLLGYDDMNRLNRVVDASGTIDRRVYDARGLVTAVWIGTNDSGATAGDPSGGGANGNNMKQTTANTYDEGAPGGDGNLTAVVLKVDDNALHDRLTENAYDFRNRKTHVTTDDGDVLRIAVTDYDNLDHPVEITQYHTSVTTSNRIARERTFYDAMGRVFREERDGIDIATGDVVNILASQNWFDGAGNVIKSSRQGRTSFQKTVYDGLNRSVQSFQACVVGTAGVPEGDDNDVSSDTVLEQTETVYDDAGNVIQTCEYRRLDNASGTGALQGPNGPQPQARINWRAVWPDAIGRERASADYGTCGGLELQRPPVVPPRSEIVLVTTTSYKSDGEANAVIDPMGHATRWDNNAAGQRIRLVENYVEGTPAASRVSEYVWHASGALERLTLINAQTGNQVTRWVYGTTLADSTIASNRLLRGKIYPESDDRPQPLDSGPDGVYARQEFTYNRQNEITSFTDADGTVHQYDYDKLGRQLADRVTTLAEHLNGSVRRINYAYEVRGMLARVTSHDAPSGGSVVNEVERVYDAFGQLSEDRQSHDGVVDGSTPKVVYASTDGSGNILRRTGITYPDGRELLTAYGTANAASDHCNRVTALQVEDEEADLVNYTYAGLAWQVQVAYPQPDLELTYKKLNGEATGDAGDLYNGYDRFNRTVDIRWRSTDGEGADVERLQYGFNANSWRTWRRRNLAQQWDQHFGYDGLGQVVQADRGDLNLNLSAVAAVPQQGQRWHYDQTGNWRFYQTYESGVPALEQPRVHDRGNRLMEIGAGAAPVRVDRAGRMLELPPDASGDWEESVDVQWDAWSRIVKVGKFSEEEVFAEYAYDGLFRRIVRTVDGVDWHCYYSDQWRPLEERENEETSPTMQYFWGVRHRDDLVRRDRATVTVGEFDETRYALTDYYSPAAVTDGSGEVTERYAFSAFGIRQLLTPGFAVREESECLWEFAFQGQFEDTETGWLDYGYRYYVPYLGRWPSKDPIEERGGLNLYAVSGNDSVNQVDALGLQPQGRGCPVPKKTKKPDKGKSERPKKGGVQTPPKPPGHQGFHHYGRWGGPGWGNGGWNYEDGLLPPYDESVEPVDKRDACYKDHDYCVAGCVTGEDCPCPEDKKKASDCIEKCDKKLAECLRNAGVKGLEPWAFDTMIPWLVH